MKNVLCTVGTSLLGNFNRFENAVLREVALDALEKNDYARVADILASFPESDRNCGAEINSIFELRYRGIIGENFRLHFLISDTPDGEKVGKILERFYHGKGIQVNLVVIEGLLDKEPKRFRREGLRNLIKQMARVLREYGSENCLINATGGYKAQIAVAVMLGQALGVNVYYKHEQFSEIISFPPLPFSLDQDLWLKYNYLFTVLDNGAKDLIELEEVKYEELDEKIEPLINREVIEGKTYIELSTAGQIFHETLKSRWQTIRQEYLPPIIPEKSKVFVEKLQDHNWPDRELVIRIMNKIIKKVPFVRTCRTNYLNPDLPKREGFILKRGEIVGIISRQGWTVSFVVDTNAKSERQKEAAVEYLNSNLDEFYY
ncbi:putative CRISPR-associated protein [Carboxydothermus hydrogenoformans]|uniref:Putative CRISPR-associated protein, APE2256 family n=1 Tax=Carboxydothermus hydrogenoformans (strain ATCC BAA-161 / DSM 6008 / Z-2901) TaxID=246194 RepID=Q3AA97_CARHZ|nr:putative CRISPR-associated protein [Carboxydothermus hydrogenoformans]ABB14582.1 putative CRISPR-associated protein, APE2256 family [Carboxydothermus hydrogenoformans Z-2901]